ncbi:MAG: alanine racemase [Chloroflexota bacterium]|jgi:alanine racemase
MESEQFSSQLDAIRKQWPCWIEVDLDAIRHNVQAVRGFLGPNCQVMAVVKSQAYGHGMVPVARAALEAGATWLGVSRVREGVQLRNANVSARILILGPVTKAEIPTVIARDLTATVVSDEIAEALSEAATVAGRKVPVHIKIDTGLGRYGVPFEKARALALLVSRLPGLQLEALYSHFATADDEDDTYAASQMDEFQKAREALEREGLSFPLVHIAASGGTLGVSNSHLNMVRLGLSLYGLYPAQHLAGKLSLVPALSMRSRIARIFNLKPGQSVGYGRTFIASKAITAALVPVGYADGLPRSHSNRGFVLVNGQRARLIGRVSMDQCVVDISACGLVRVGDPVVVIGRQGNECISCDEFAERSGTISYEVITSLGYRVPRVLLSKGSVAGVAYLDEGRVGGCEY